MRYEENKYDGDLARNMLELIANELDRDCPDARTTIEDRYLLRKKPYKLFIVYFVIPPVCGEEPQADHAEWSTLLHLVVDKATDEIHDYLMYQGEDFNSIGLSETCGLQTDHNLSIYQQEALLGRPLLEGERIGSFLFYGRGSMVNFTIAAAPSTSPDDVEVGVYSEKKPEIHYMPEDLLD